MLHSGTGMSRGKRQVKVKGPTVESWQVVGERLVCRGLRCLVRQRDRERALKRDDELRRADLLKVGESLFQTERVGLLVDGEVAEYEQLLDQLEALVDEEADLSWVLGEGGLLLPVRERRSASTTRRGFAGAGIRTFAFANTRMFRFDLRAVVDLAPDAIAQ